jgi:ketosteroid isomerase-like protein
MSRDNVELHYRVIDAYNRRDLDAFLGLMDDEVEAVSRLAAIEGGYHGHAGIRRWWSNLFEVLPDTTIEVIEVDDRGELTLATLRLRGHGADSDTPFEETLWQAGQWRHGKSVWWQVFPTEAEAVEAAGLREWAMSRENMEVIEEGWRAINRRDVDALVHLVTDDLDLRPPSHLLDGTVFRGNAGIRAWMERNEETWREVEGSPHLLASVGEQLVVAIDVRLVGHDSGVPVDQRVFVVYTLREGKAAAMIAYPSEADALEAVGLRD